MNEYDAHSSENPRILFFLAIVIIASATLLAGLAWKQLMAKEEFQEIERRQTERRILKPGPRGDIYDREGRLLVGNRPHYSAVVYLDDLRPEFRKEYSELLNAARKKIDQEYETLPASEQTKTKPSPNHTEISWQARENVINRHLNKINTITGRQDTVRRSKLIRHFNEQLLLPLPLVEDLSSQEYAKLVERIPVQSVIQIQTSTARYYPHKSLASHSLGYVQSTFPDESEIPNDGIKTFTFKKRTGKTGIERSFDAHLNGTTGMEIWRVDPLGFQETLLEVHPPKQGKDLITSIDLDIQKTAENALGDRTGAAVALDIQTGEILAIASNPNYDLNKLSPFIPQTVFDEINERGAWLNRSVQLSYPPGSTFKLITAIAGLRSDYFTTETEHNCQGIYRVGRRVFRCHARNGHGTVDVATMIEGSCNVFCYAEGLKMGIDTISAEAKRFGLDVKTGIELPFETSRIVVPNKEWKRERIGAGWVPGDTANTAIGQGFLLNTPLQMATVIASIARNETRTKPTLKALSREEGLKVDHGGEPIGLTETQKAALWEGMERVVGPKGTGRLVRIEGVRIAGKTGTADFRAHGKEVNLAWFIGFAPIEDPRIAVAVMVEGTETSQDYHGGSTAGPVAKDIFQTYLDKNI